MDFVTGLPVSDGMTAILSIVDRFSKAAHFIGLLKLPSARSTAVLLKNHVFGLHGIPLDILSDRGPQFISQVWKLFCHALGATVSQSSGFNPQTESKSGSGVRHMLCCGTGGGVGCSIGATSSSTPSQDLEGHQGSSVKDSREKQEDC